MKTFNIIFQRLNSKFVIFIGTKNLFNPYIYRGPLALWNNQKKLLFDSKKLNLYLPTKQKMERVIHIELTPIKIFPLSFII